MDICPLRTLMIMGNVLVHLTAWFMLHHYPLSKLLGCSWWDSHRLQSWCIHGVVYGWWSWYELKCTDVCSRHIMRKRQSSGVHKVYWPHDARCHREGIRRRMTFSSVWLLLVLQYSWSRSMMSVMLLQPVLCFLCTKCDDDNPTQAS